MSIAESDYQRAAFYFVGENTNKGEETIQHKRFKIFRSKSDEIKYSMEAIIENNIQTIEELCERHHIKKLYAFGSAVTGGFNNESDVDLLYEFDYTGFDFNNLKNIPYDPFLVFFDLKEMLEDLFQRKVDLIPYQDFKNKYFNDEVERTKQLIYAAERFEKIPA